MGIKFKRQGRTINLHKIENQTDYYNRTISNDINNNNIIQSLDHTINLPSETSSKDEAIFKGTIHKARIFIRNIHHEVHEKMLSKFFSKYGKIKKARIIRNTKNESKEIGYVQFYNENDVSQVFNNIQLDPLILNNRKVIICPFVFKPKNNHSFDKGKSTEAEKINENWPNEIEMNATNLEQLDSLNIHDLPVDVLLNIFLRLDLRSLCISEKVCKRWFSIAREIWSAKKNLVLYKKNRTDMAKYSKWNKYALELEIFGDHDAQILRKILSRIRGNLKRLDLSGLGDRNLETKPVTQTVFGSLGRQRQKDLKNSQSGSKRQCLRNLSLSHVVDLCPNITHLNIAYLNISNESFKYLRQLKKLQILNMSYNIKISDNSLIKILQNCKELEAIQMSGCSKITGKFFHAYGINLKSLRIDRCQDINHENLKNLLSESRTLKSLDLSYRKSNPILVGLNFFWEESMVCSLEELNLSFIKEINDRTLQSLSPLKNSLKSLMIKGCYKLTVEGITEAMTELKMLTYFDVGSNHRVDNDLLIKALDLTNRKITINCNNTSVCVAEFRKEFPETAVSEYIVDSKYKYYKYIFKNLTFRARLTHFPYKYSWYDSIYFSTSLYDHEINFSFDWLHHFHEDENDW